MTRDPFFPDWIYDLGMPHFDVFDMEVYNILFELTIIAFILQALYIELVVERRLKKQKDTKKERKHP